MTTVQERVDHLEDVAQDFVTNTDIQFNKLQKSQMELQNTNKEIQNWQKEFQSSQPGKNM